MKQIGYPYGFKVDNWDTTDPFGYHHVTESGSVFHITISNIVTNDEGEIISFEWSSTQPIYVVIVIGGNKANVFEYPMGAISDDYLYAPTNPETGKPYTISHVTFCWEAPNFVIPKTLWGVLGTMLNMLAAVAVFTRKGSGIKL